MAINLEGAEHERQKAFLGIRKLFVQDRQRGLNLVQTRLVNCNGDNGHRSNGAAGSDGGDGRLRPLNDLLQVRYSYLARVSASLQHGFGRGKDDVAEEEADHSLSVVVAPIVVAWHPQVTMDLVDTLMDALPNRPIAAVTAAGDAQPEEPPSAEQPHAEQLPGSADVDDLVPPSPSPSSPLPPPKIDGDSTESVKWDQPAASPYVKRQQQHQKRAFFKVSMHSLHPVSCL